MTVCYNIIVTNGSTFRNLVFISNHVMMSLMLTYSINFFIQWVVTEQACSAYSMIVVPLYDTLARDAVSYIVNQGKKEN